MKNDLTCALVRDLLPSYVEGLTSEETNQAVEAHLASCPACAAVRDRLRDPEPEPQEEAREVDYLKKVKRRGGKRVILAVLLTLLAVTGAILAKIFLIGSPASADTMAARTWTEGDMLRVEVTSSVSANAWWGWDTEVENGTARITAREGIVSPIHPTAYGELGIPLEGLKEVYLCGKLIWQDGVEITRYARAVYEARTPYVGDAVATGADEVGIAMQKTAASAGIANLTLEQTSAIIGTISSITREAAEVIGTSVNAMISRYAKITQTGMNQIFQDEDGQMVAVNDIAKALATIDIELYNTQTGFTGLWDILSQVNQQWDTMDDGQRNYIATMFAGTRQMNRFVALMENFDMAMELNEGAMNSSGLAAEKYAIWQESAAAAQNNFNSALENLYASFIEGGTITSFYNTLAGLIDLITDGFNSGVGQMVMVVGGATVVIGGIVSVFKALVPAIKAAIMAQQAYRAAVATGVKDVEIASAAVSTMGKAMKLAIPVVALLATGIMAAVGWLSNMADSAEETAQKVEEMKSRIGEIDTDISSIDSILKRLEELSNKSYLSTSEMEELESIQQQ